MPSKNLFLVVDGRQRDLQAQLEVAEVKVSTARQIIDYDSTIYIDYSLFSTSRRCICQPQTLAESRM